MYAMLGRTGEASMFGPVTSLYLFVPVLYGLIFVHESLTVRVLWGVLRVHSGVD